MFYDVKHTRFSSLYLYFDDKDHLRAITFSEPQSLIYGKNSASESLKKQLDEYFLGKRKSFEVKIIIDNASSFQKRVWETLLEIPYGDVKTYKWLSKKIDLNHAYRAVGIALNMNPIPIIIPCHRIIKSDGSIGGYSGGIGMKRFLIELERTKQKN